MTIKELPLNQKLQFIRDMMNEVYRWREALARYNKMEGEWRPDLNWYACYGMRHSLEILYGDTSKTFLSPFMSDFGEMVLRSNPRLYTDDDLLADLLKAFDVSLVEYEDYIHKETIIIKREDE